MFKFRIKNRNEALELIAALKHHDRPLGHPFFGYLIFLATELDQKAATALMDSYRGLDSLTGPLIAGIVCVDEIAAPLNGQLMGIDREEKEYEESVSVSNLEYIASKGECTDKDLNARERLTNATDRVARVLGITNKLPCIAVLDCKSQSEAEIIELPDDQELLVSFIRELMSELTSFDKHDNTSFAVLEEMSELYSDLQNLERHQDSFYRAEEYLTNVSGNPSKKLSEILGVSKSKVSNYLTPKRVACLRTLKNLSSIDDQEFRSLELLFDLNVGPIGDSYSVHNKKLRIFSGIIESILPGYREDVLEKINALKIKAALLDESASNLEIPSLRESANKVAKRRSMKVIKHKVLAESGMLARELTKPSLWFKVSQYFM